MLDYIEPIELYVIVAKSKAGDVILSPELDFADATAKLNKIKRFRKSARLELAGYASNITRFDEIGEVALSLICKTLVDIEDGCIIEPSLLEDVLNQLFELIVLMGIANRKNHPQAAN